MTSPTQQERYDRRRERYEQTIAYARSKWPAIGELADYPLTYALLLDLNKRPWASRILLAGIQGSWTLVLVFVVFFGFMESWKRFAVLGAILLLAFVLNALLKQPANRVANLSFLRAFKKTEKQFLFDLWMTPLNVNQMACIAAMAEFCRYCRFSRVAWRCLLPVFLAVAIYFLELMEIRPKNG